MKNHSLKVRQGPEVELVDVDKFCQLTDRRGSGSRALILSCQFPLLYVTVIQTCSSHELHEQSYSRPAPLRLPQHHPRRQDVPRGQEDRPHHGDHAGQEEERLGE